MFAIHHTSDGKSLPIYQMSDQHLRNFIRLVLKKIGEVQAAAGTSGLDPYQAALHGISPVSAADAGRKNREAYERLYPYLTEAYLRGMDDVRAMFVATIGRSTGIEAVPQLPARVANYFDDEQVEWDDDDEEDDGPPF